MPALVVPTGVATPVHGVEADRIVWFGNACTESAALARIDDGTRTTLPLLVPVVARAETGVLADDLQEVAAAVLASTLRARIGAAAITRSAGRVAPCATLVQAAADTAELAAANWNGELSRPTVAAKLRPLMILP